MKAPETPEPIVNRWRLVAVAAAVIIVVYAVLLASFSSPAFPTTMRSHAHWPSLMDKPVGEDGYYMLTVADNIATRGSILYNHNAPATGIQPLATVLFAMIDVIVRAVHGDPLDLIRGVMLLGAILFVCFAIQMSRIAKSLCSAEFAERVAALTVLLVLFDYTLFRLFTYGLETGVYLICIAACFASTRRVASMGATSAREMVWLGLWAGLAGEARIDFGILFLFLLGGLLTRRWIRWDRAVGAGAIALVVVSPWFWFVHRVSGSWIPSSGAAESTPINGLTLVPRLLSMVVALTSQLAPWTFGVFSYAALLVALVNIVLLAALAITSSTQRDRVATGDAWELVRLWLPGLAVLVTAYIVFFNSTQFYYRYAAPVSVLAIPVLAVLLMKVPVLRNHLPEFAVMLAGSFVLWTTLSLHTGRVSNSQVVAAGYVQEYFPMTHVGAFQSGVVGYFNRNVENLDGKLNGPALVATRSHALPAFIDREQIDVIVDWPSLIHANLPPAYLAREWRPCPVPLTGSESVCIERKPHIAP